jgi:hypothetical protein
MLRLSLALAGTVLALFAAVSFLFFCVTVSTPLHPLGGNEREHLEAAKQFVTEHLERTGFVPDYEEFHRWADEKDKKGFRFEGKGFSVDACGIKKGDYCISFWDRDVDVTFESWRHSTEYANLGDRRLGWIVLTLFATLAFASASYGAFAYSGSFRKVSCEPG